MVWDRGRRKTRTLRERGGSAERSRRCPPVCPAVFLSFEGSPSFDRVCARLPPPLQVLPEELVVGGPRWVSQWATLAASHVRTDPEGSGGESHVMVAEDRGP